MMSPLQTQSSSRGSEQPKSVLELYHDRQRELAIADMEASIESLSTSFEGLAGEEKKSLRQRYGDGYRRIMDYYRRGEALPIGGRSVYTFINVDEVWLGFSEEMMAKKRKLNLGSLIAHVRRFTIH